MVSMGFGGCGGDMRRCCDASWGGGRGGASMGREAGAALWIWRGEGHCCGTLVDGGDDAREGFCWLCAANAM